MLTKTLKMSSLLLAMFPLTSQAQPVESCLGELYTYREAQPEITPPTIKILGQTLPQLKAGETLRLTADIVAQGQTNLVWCTPTGQLLKNSDDLKAVIYRAPTNITEDQVVAIGVQVDDNGYVGGDTILIYLQKSVAGETLILVGTSQNIQQAYTPDGKAFTGQVAASTGNITVDINGDGTPDTIIGSKTADEITINGSALKVFGSATNGSSTTTSGSANNQGKTAICHKGKNTLYLPTPAIKAHLNHGDSLGECAQTTPITTGSTTLNIVHGVNVGVGDLDGDGVSEVVAAMASAGSRVEIYSDNQLVTGFDAFSGNTGLLIAVGDINGDGIAEIIVAEVNGKEVRIFNSDGVQQGSFSTTENITSLAIGKGSVATQTPLNTGSTATNIQTTTSSTAPACPTSTTLSFTCTGQNQSVTNATIEKDVSVSNLALRGNTNSQGTISNSTIAENSTLTGGALTGDTSNHGKVKNVTFLGRLFEGGIIEGKFINASQVGGVVQNPILAAYAHLSGGKVAGKIIGDITGTSVLSNVTILAGSTVINVQLGENVIIEKGATVVVSPSVLPLQETSATDAQGKSITTKTHIAAGIKVNNDDFKSNVAHKQSDTVEFTLRIEPDPAHIDKVADVIVYGSYQKSTDSTPILFSVLDDKGTVREWDGKPASLLAFRKNIQLETLNELPLFKGSLSDKGHLQIFVGYRLVETGESFITKLPLTTSIGE